MHLARSRTFWRLFLSYGLLVLVSTGVLGFVIINRVERYEFEQVEESLRVKAILVEEDVRELSADQVPRLQPRVVALFREIKSRITLLAADGRVLADSAEDPAAMENHATRREIMDAKDRGTGTSVHLSQTTGQTMMYAARRVEGGSSPVGFVRVARSIDSIQDELAELRRVVWTGTGATALIALFLAAWLARRTALPLQELTDGAQRIASGAYGHKVYPMGADEVGTLARAFNAMSERLADQFARVEEDRQQLRAVLSGMVEGVVAIDADQRILFANERAGQLLEFVVQTALGRKLWEVVRQPTIQEIVRRAPAATEPFHEQLDWSGPGVRSLDVHVAPMSGLPTGGAVLVLHDTSELRRLERLRQEFVANVSHELKTPLSVIKVCVETLLDGAVEDAENRGAFLQQVDEQANRLHVLILDLLSLARIESGAELFQLEAVPLQPLVDSCVERHRARADSKKQQLEALPSANGHTTDAPTAWADEEALSQIVDNLVDNALKYTPEGGRIGVRYHVEDGQVCLEVTDNGIGIPERDLPRVFERFYRVDKARSREMGGTGLGLSIVKHLVQAMRGTVRAESRVGEGTTFTVRLPSVPATTSAG
ncbi:MAG: cell wall metabolism sensor histidine kinase WalK [Gemmataceae bacterium]|nr:cell wall metabolism sensor histidine kinase WalK [Gemmataceae bacterium]